MRPRDELFEAIAAACHIDIALLTDTARGQLNRARRELHAAGATPPQVEAAARVWANQYPRATLTPSALAKHWPALAAKARPEVASPRVLGRGVDDPPLWVLDEHGNAVPATRA